MAGALNDRLLIVNPTDISPKQKKGFEVKSCLVGLLEPLLIGFATMQQYFEQKLDLSEILYQITSRFSFLFLLDMISFCKTHFIISNRSIEYLTSLAFFSDKDLTACV